MRKSTNGPQLLIVNLPTTRFALELDTAEDPLDSTKTVGDHRALDYDDLLDLVPTTRNFSCRTRRRSGSP
ncbi:hypothetical protein BH24ACT15_BH24ACT15_36930 [soil metagenome]